MMTTIRRAPMRVAACAVLACAAAAASAAVVPPGTALADRQELVRNEGAEPESLDPALAQSVQAADILVDLFETLAVTDAHGRSVPGAAQSWQQVDGTTWVFKLRRGATWSDGQPVTAQDFVYAWRRMVDPKTASPLASASGAYLVNGVAIAQGKLPPSALGVRAVDDLTLELKTPGPVPFLPDVLTTAQFMPVPRAVIDKCGSAWTRPGNLVGNGAYVLKDWQVNSKVVVQKNPRYWDAANVTLTRVTRLPVEDPGADLKLYQSGEVDMMFVLAPGTFPSLKVQYPREMHVSLLTALRDFALNNQDPLLKDVRVRHALSMVLDRGILADRITADGQHAVAGLWVASNTGVDPVHYDWESWPMERRVAEARKLLAEAGVRPGTPLKLAYDTGDYQKRIALFAATEWKAKLGLDVQLENMEKKVLLHRESAGDYQVGRHGWIPGFVDVTGLLMLVECDNDANYNRSCNKPGDALMKEAALTADAARRKALLTQAMRLEMDDYPLVPLLQMSVARLVRPWVGGYADDNDQDTHRSKDLYILKH